MNVLYEFGCKKIQTQELTASHVRERNWNPHTKARKCITKKKYAPIQCRPRRQRDREFASRRFRFSGSKFDPNPDANTSGCPSGAYTGILHSFRAPVSVYFGSTRDVITCLVPSSPPAITRALRGQDSANTNANGLQS
jgi:hypothetical protein